MAQEASGGEPETGRGRWLAFREKVDHAGRPEIGKRRAARHEQLLTVPFVHRESRKSAIVEVPNFRRTGSMFGFKRKGASN